MKRLIFCFDGTWNRLSAPNPTNVVVVSQNVIPVTKEGIVQSIHYDPGVGTGEEDHWRGGMLGMGLIDKVASAYTFLCFNYDPGDEIFVFGFSRGAFTARAFVGFVRTCGIIQRKHAGKIDEAIELYKGRRDGESHNDPRFLQFRSAYAPETCIDKGEDAWRVENCKPYATGSAGIFRIKYLGVWDTVEEAGVPADVPFANYLNRNLKYFDAELSSMVVSARHAVSIDEDRKTFAPTLWPNFEALNNQLGFTGKASDAPYQQKWFPGDHGSVGGGGEIRGLSDRALDWVLDGARNMGLKMDTDPESPLFRLNPNDFAPLKNMKPAPQTLAGAIMSHLPTAHRQPGPTRIEDLSESAINRWLARPDKLPEGVAYRPPTLSAVADTLNAITGGDEIHKPQADHPPIVLPPHAAPVPGALYTLVYGDTLRGLAHKLYGDAAMADVIFAANRPGITDPNRVYIGQVIYLPEVGAISKAAA